jgi:hypothetical protein
MRTLYTLLAITLGISTNAFGQEIEVRPLAVTMEVVTEPVRLSFLISNQTDKFIDVNNVEVMLPASFGQTDLTMDCDRDALDLSPKESARIECNAPPVHLAQKPSLLFFRHRDNDKAEVKLLYQIREPGQAQRSASGTVSLAPLGPWLGVLLGGIFGVIVSILFPLVYEKARNIPKVGADRAPWWANLLLGLLVISIASLLFRYTSVKAPDLPIAVEVRDYIGGFALGLIFQPLANWLGKIIIPPAASAAKPTL